MVTKLDNIRDPRLKEQIKLGLKCCGERARQEPPEETYSLESELLADCAEWLQNRDYHPMTAKNVHAVMQGFPCRGWYIHLVECERNPLLPDLLLTARPNTRPPLMIELKIHNKWQPGQKEAIQVVGWKVAWTLAELRKYVTEWEG